MRCLFFSLFILFFLSIASAEYKYVSFNDSMYVLNQIELTNQDQDYEFYKSFYEKRNPNITTCNQNSIPKIIHQIWLGSKPIPSQYTKLADTWKKLHPTWQYKLWKDKDIKNWQFSSKDLFDKASSYQEKADILRYEILNKYGGVYVDMDYEAIKSLDPLTEKYDFFASIEPPLGKSNYIAITNAIFASKSNNPILLETLKKIRAHWNDLEREFSNITFNSSNKKKELIHLAVNRTMTPFKHTINQFLPTEECMVVFPPTYMSIENRNKFFDKVKNFLKIKSKRLHFRIIHPETIARQLRGQARDITDLRGIKNNQKNS